MGFPENLRRFRKAARLTQEGLALACGWSGQSRIANYEKGDREPTLAELAVLADALKVSRGELLGDVGLNGSSIRPVAKPPSEAGTTSHLATLDPDILHEALTLLFHDEQQAGDYAPRAQSARLADLYGRVAADGGRLTAQHNRVFEAEIEERRRGRENGGNELARRRATKRRRK